MGDTLCKILTLFTLVTATNCASLCAEPCLVDTWGAEGPSCPQENSTCCKQVGDTGKVHCLPLPPEPEHE